MPGRQVLGSLLLLPLLAGALFGGDAFGLRDRVFPPNSVVSGQALDRAASHALQQAGELVSEPYWTPLADLDGAATITANLHVDAAALQWRVRWTCAAGRIDVEARSATGTARLVEAACPGSGEAYAVTSGAVTLHAVSGGALSLIVEEQVDAPAAQPPPPALQDPGSHMLARGSVYGVDQQGQGSVALYRVADGSRLLRLENFYVTPNIDFELRFSTLLRPSSTADYLHSESALIAPLAITAGSLNFAVPSGVDTSRYHSMVVWCPQLTSVYAAASLSTP
ncbi:MAG: DM13 domain-containing protein [Candidatus Dormibacteria bacterium]